MSLSVGSQYLWAGFIEDEFSKLLPGGWWAARYIEISPACWRRRGLGILLFSRQTFN